MDDAVRVLQQQVNALSRNAAFEAQLISQQKTAHEQSRLS